MEEAGVGSLRLEARTQPGNPPHKLVDSAVARVDAHPVLWKILESHADARAPRDLLEHPCGGHVARVKGHQPEVAVHESDSADRPPFVGLGHIEPARLHEGVEGLVEVLPRQTEGAASGNSVVGGHRKALVEGDRVKNLPYVPVDELERLGDAKKVRRGKEKQRE